MQDVRPFSVIACGVDFTGALYIHHRGKETKVYVCLFTCATSRAIYLEVVTDLSTETFLLAFRCFVGRWSTPQLMISNNTTIFQAAGEELKTLSSSEEVLNRKVVTCKFIPKKAPWFGGFWECLIHRLHKVCNQESTWQSPHLPAGATDDHSGSGSLVE